jgi:hypothetical protein
MEYIFINNGLMSWPSHNKSSDVLSTMKSEYMAISDASREAIAKTQFYTDPDTFSSFIPLILTDSQSALALIGAATNYQRPKHIDIRYNCIGGVIAKDQTGKFEKYQFAKFRKIPTNLQN